MGGLILVVLWPMLIPIAILYFLGVALPRMAPLLLIWNLLVLGVLLLVRRVWKKSGTMDRSYIDTQDGLKWLLLFLLRYGLLLLIAWEILLVVLLAAYMLWYPELLAALLGG